ncbi:MAG: hypothetical protein R3213_01170 [Flavobacteriaceae bacterium]|nr:hypothetical protein [Flavobacteriaceae bacterium]
MRLNPKYLPLVIYILFINTLYGQQFLEGRYTDNNDNTIHGLIHDGSWINNPDKITFKSNPEANPIELNIEAVKQFEINGKSKYKRFTIKIDESSNRIKHLNESNEPKWNTRTVFLSTLVEGEASLYGFSENGTTKYFFSKNNQLPEQLIYRRYYTEEGSVATNNYYRQQLNNIFSDCNQIDAQDLTKIDYYAKDFIKLFVEYNQCIESKSAIYYLQNSSTKFKLNLGLGLGLTNAKFRHNEASALRPDFKNITTSRIGGDAELLLPFHNNRWGIFIGYYFHSNIDETINIETSASNLDYQSVNFKLNQSELTLGVRHYIPIYEKIKGSLHFGINKFSVKEFLLDYEFSQDAQDDNTTINLCVGGGISYGRINLESKIYFNTTVIQDNTDNYEDSKYSFFALMATYTLL